MQRLRSYFSSNSLALVGGSHELLVSILVVILLVTETQAGTEGYTRGLPPQSPYQKAYQRLNGRWFFSSATLSIA